MGSPETRTTSARRWGWGILLSTGGISLTFNVAHAITTVEQTTMPGGRGMYIGLAVLYGLTPVGVALAVSHLIAIQDGGWGKRVLTGLVFIAAMALSVSAIAAVVEPIAGHWRYVFPLMLDVASLLALNEVLATGTPQQDTAPSAILGPGEGRAAGRPEPVPATGEDAVPPTVLGPSREPVPESSQTDRPERRDGAGPPAREPSQETQETQGDRRGTGDGNRPGRARDRRPAAGAKRGTAKRENRPTPAEDSPALTVPELVELMRDDYPGDGPDSVPGIGRIKSRYSVGTDKASAAQQALKAERDGRPATAQDAPAPVRPHLVHVRDEDETEPRSATGGTA